MMNFPDIEDPHPPKPDLVECPHCRGTGLVLRKELFASQVRRLDSDNPKPLPPRFDDLDPIGYESANMSRPIDLPRSDTESFGAGPSLRRNDQEFRQARYRQPYGRKSIDENPPETLTPPPLPPRDRDMFARGKDEFDFDQTSDAKPMYYRRSDVEFSEGKDKGLFPTDDFDRRGGGSQGNRWRDGNGPPKQEGWRDKPIDPWDKPNDPWDKPIDPWDRPIDPWIRNEQSDVPRRFDGDVPRRFDGDVPRRFDGDVPRRFDGDVPRRFDGDVPRRFDGDVPRRFDGDVPRRFDGGVSRSFDDDMFRGRGDVLGKNKRKRRPSKPLLARPNKNLRRDEKMNLGNGGPNPGPMAAPSLLDMEVPVPAEFRPGGFSPPRNSGPGLLPTPPNGNRMRLPPNRRRMRGAKARNMPPGPAMEDENLSNMDIFSLGVLYATNYMQ